MNDAVSEFAGFIGALLSIISLAAVFIGYGRWLEKLNGVGGRVGQLEERTTRAETERAENRRQIDQLMEQHGTMLERLGEAKRSTEACHEDTEALGIRIGTAVSELQREVSTRLTRVETILQERAGQFTQPRKSDDK